MNFLKHNLISILLVSVLVISIFTLLFAASISFKQIKSLIESEKLVVHSYKIYVELEQLNSYAKDAETGQRGFLLTGDSSFLHPYYDTFEKVNKSFDRLKLLIAGNSQQSLSLDTLVSLVNQRFYFLDNVLSRKDFKVNTSDTLKRLIVKGRDIMTLTHTQIDRMVINELQLLKKREMDHEKDIKLSPFSLLFIVLFSLFVFIISFYKINRDLKRLTKTNNQLLINNEIFEHSEQIADISHWYWNTSENKLSYSTNLYHLLGCSPDEFEPTFGNFMEFVHPADRHLFIEGNQMTMRGLFPSMTFFRIIRKDGVIRHFKSIAKVITDNYGTGFSIGVNADITEQHFKDKLIEEKLADLERSNNQLSAFNHIASHDLQEHLRKVQIFISRIREKDFESIPEKAKDYLSGIEKATYRMQKFIEDLLIYSRANKANKNFEPADLNEILENSKRDLSQRIEEKNVTINSLSLLPNLNVVPFQIHQLFINIISNSIKYSKSGIDPVINVNTIIVQGRDIPESPKNTDHNFYKISFSDNGIGFDQQYAENIFTLFYRLHSNKEYSGTGIGLAICKIIVENHRGFISAEGIPNVGSTFSIFLPV